MEDSVLGVWVAHGEGRFFAPDGAVLDEINAKGLAPVRYVDDAGVPTEAYPFNPNGSPDGITALCSPDGRHLAMMPHPERAFQLWQWPWLPAGWEQLPASPWLRMFQNAREWVEGRG
jgi:phosphoribosylformylglycinamidine synthase